MSRDSGKQVTAVLPLAKIIPIHRDTWVMQRSLASASERGRHYLKVTLPAIPVLVFTMTFLMIYFIEVGDAAQMHEPINPAPALLGALMITFAVAALCAAIYTGFRHVAGLADEELLRED